MKPVQAGAARQDIQRFGLQGSNLKLMYTIPTSRLRHTYLFLHVVQVFATICCPQHAH